MVSTLYSLYFSCSYSHPLSLQSRRLSVPLSMKSPSVPLYFKNTHRFIKSAISDQYHEKDERNEKVVCFSVTYSFYVKLLNPFGK